MLREFVSCIERFPERNAFCINGILYQYNRFAKIISGIKDLINQLSDPAVKSIGVTSFDSIETYATFFAALFAGKTFVPIDPSNPIDRNSLMISLAEIKVILTSRMDDNVLKMSKEFPGVKFINTQGIQSPGISLTAPQAKPEDTAYILFTSGSTGVPKAVPLSHKNVNSFIDAFLALGYNIDENDRCLQSSDLLFDLSTMSYMVPLLKGACVYTVPEEGIRYANILEILTEREITFALMVPSVLNYLRPFFKDIMLEKMRYSLFCGEALYGDIISEWTECVPNALIQNVYGPTEATNFCLTYDWNKNKSLNKIFNGVICIGKPMKNMEAIVIDENYNQLPVGEKGELCLAGLQLTSGYLKNPEKNDSAFFKICKDGLETTFYKTGDVSFKDNEDDFFYCGRKDYQIKIHGYRIELGEIEYHARQFLSPSNAAAVAYQTEAGLTKIHLFVEQLNGRSDKLTEYLKSKIPQYMQPYKITSLESFPLNSNGKVDRKALLKFVNE